MSILCSIALYLALLGMTVRMIARLGQTRPVHSRPARPAAASIHVDRPILVREIVGRNVEVEPVVHEARLPPGTTAVSRDRELVEV